MQKAADGLASGLVSSIPARFIPDVMKGMPLNFLQNIQWLHDSNEYWNLTEGKGLSVAGNEHVAKIKEMWINKPLGDYTPAGQ
jgi:hypothetical protein